MDTQETLIQMKAWAKQQRDYASLVDNVVALLEGTLQTQATNLENKYKNTIKELTDEKVSLAIKVEELTSAIDSPVLINNLENSENATPKSNL